MKSYNIKFLLILIFLFLYDANTLNSLVKNSIDKHKERDEKSITSNAENKITYRKTTKVSYDTNQTSITNQNNIKSTSNENQSSNFYYSDWETKYLSQYLMDREKYFFARNINCNKVNCREPSACLDNHTCGCKGGYVNINIPLIANDQYCFYKQKSQLIAFFLELFIPIGVGHWYAGRLGCGFYKFALICLPLHIILILYCCFMLQMKNRGSKENDDFKSSEFYGLFVPIFIFLFIVWITWQMFDIYYFANNLYRDGNNVPLYSGI